jgi:hypothetical protein
MEDERGGPIRWPRMVGQFDARYIGENQYRFARCVHAMNGKDVLGKINPDGDNAYGLPLPANE